MIDKLHQWATHFSFRELKRPIDVEILHVLPTHVNAFYSQHENKFGIPAAILQPPFFGRSRPKALNYGGIGMVVGHEITHGFDVMGSHFDKKGQITNWWDMNTLKTFHRRAACMIKQYAKFGVKDSEGKWHGVDGNATLSENMADNGGFKAAYQVGDSIDSIWFHLNTSIFYPFCVKFTRATGERLLLLPFPWHKLENFSTQRQVSKDVQQELLAR